MDPVAKTLQWNCQSYSPNELMLLDVIQQHSFDSLKVLEYGGSGEIAQYIAQTAKVVHSNSTDWSNEEITKKKEKYSHITNLSFTKPQILYDCIVIADPLEICPSNLQNNLSVCYKHLETNGEILSFCFLKPNYCILQKTFDIFYPQHYAAFPESKIKELNLTCPQDYTSDFFSYDELEKTPIIFKIKSHQPRLYNIIITDKKQYKSWLKERFAAFIDSLPKEFELVPETTNLLQKQFVAIAMDQLQHDSNGNMIYPINIASLLWSKIIIKMHMPKYMRESLTKINESPK